MFIVDSCGWLEWFADGALAEQYKKYLAKSDQLLVPSIILYEVYKVLKREAGEDIALNASAYMKNSPTIPIDDTLALFAADLSLQHQLAMADAIIFATALTHNCEIITSDSDLQNLQRVTFFQKP